MNNLLDELNAWFSRPFPHIFRRAWQITKAVAFFLIMSSYHRNIRSDSLVKCVKSIKQAVTRPENIIHNVIHISLKYDMSMQRWSLKISKMSVKYAGGKVIFCDEVFFIYSAMFGIGRAESLKCVRCASFPRSQCDVIFSIARLDIEISVCSFGQTLTLNVGIDGTFHYLCAILPMSLF